MNPIKKPVLVGCLLLTASTLFFSFANDNGDKKKKYQIIHQSNGETITYDTLLPMSSTFSPEQFLKAKGISEKNAEIIVLPGISAMEGEEKKMKTIVRELKIEDNGEGSEMEEVEIKVEIDENGNMTAKKTVNGVEVEMTEEELTEIKSQNEQQKMVEIKFHDEKPGMQDERVEIKVEIDDEGKKTVKKFVNGKEVEMTQEDMDKLEIMEHNGGNDMPILINREMSEETDGEVDKEIKVINRRIEMHPAGEGDEMHQESKDGEQRVLMMSTEGNEDFTLVLVTENYDAANEGKTKMIFELATKEMNSSPNPNDGVFTIRYESDENAKTTITVTDANGKTVFEDKLGKFSGNYEKEVDLKKFGSGIYTITIQSGNNENVQKVMIN